MSRGATFSQKWGDDPFTKMGHIQVPNALARYSSRLGLGPDECWLIVCILSFKHDESNPYPGQEMLAQMFGRDLRTVQRLVAKIKKRGLLTVIPRRGDHAQFDHLEYDFTALRSALNECYYQDHPQDAPKPIRQNCRMDRTTHGTTDLSYGRDDITVRQICRTNKMNLESDSSPDKKERKDSSASLFSEEDAPKSLPVSASRAVLATADTEFARGWRKRNGIAEPVKPIEGEKHDA